MFKLNKLDANKKSFHSIKFNDGINIVMGKSGNSSKDNKKKKTINGVGKSLIIKIIDFCLGSDKNETWENPLKGWVFYLEYSLENDKHTIKRSVVEDKYELENVQPPTQEEIEKAENILGI